MHLTRLSLVAILGLLQLLFIATSPANAQPTTAEQAAIAGQLTKLSFDQSKIFPGTTRDVWLYVPAQYDGTKPACVAAFCDGQSYVKPGKPNFVPAIFDKLIAAGEMPVTIGVFASPGIVPPPEDSVKGALPRFNRSYEYDGLGDDYARFLDTELLPFLAKEYDLKLSNDPNNRLVGGASSGGVCAFNTAWARPDRFRRVWCTVGTFVGLRGGDELHSLVRKTEAKPLRIFLHDGSNDLNIYAGDWWMANQQMQRALEWMGYEHKFIWDEVGHGRKGEMEYLTDAMRYLWKDWPQPIQTQPDKAGKRRGNFVLPNEPWELVSKGHKFTEGPAANGKGEVFFTDKINAKIHKIDVDGNVTEFAKDTGGANGTMFSPDGQLVVCAPGKRQIVSYDESGNASVIAKAVSSNDLCIRADGTIFFTSPKERKLFRIAPGAKEAEAVDDFPDANGILLTPDQTQLIVGEYNGRMLTAFQVTKNGKLTHKQPYYWVHSPYRTERPSVDGMAVDSEGWLYVATKLGVQIFDQAGRVNFIIPPPAGARHPSNVCFGGPDRDYLFATCGGKVYRRRLSKKGVYSWELPVTPVKPRL